MAYEGQCGTCDNFEEAKGKKPYNKSNSKNVKGFCTWYRSFYYPDDSCDSHYRKRGSSNDCYITTMVCDKLGFDDQCDTLNTLRDFRNNVLQKDEKYSSILYEYDIVGPMIAYELRNEDVDLILDLYNGFIVPIVSDIKNKSYNEAISKYTIMTKCLEESYGIDYRAEMPKNYDYKNGGHGTLKVKKYKLAI